MFLPPMGELSTQSFAAPLLGGALIGLSASLLLFFLGRVAGITGILAGVLDGPRLQGWRVFFIAGLLAAGLLGGWLFPEAFRVEIERSPAAVAAAGLLVGFGARLGGGCTSGHGVCGISRLSPRSLVATMTFMLAGAVTVYLVSNASGGAL